MLRSNRLVAMGVALALAGCAAQSGVAERRALAPGEQPLFTETVDKSVFNPPANGSESLAKAAEALRFIKQMDLPRASKAINAALQLDGRDSHLHFLNGFVYHLHARQGDSQKNELAIEGYRMALRLDPGNWIAQEFLGLAYLDLKQFARAKEQFAQVLLMAPDTTVSMYGLMVTSYLTGDPDLACAMADEFREHATVLESTFVRSSVAVYASCGKFDAADVMRNELLNMRADPTVVERAEARLVQWKELHRSSSARTGVRMQNAAAFTITPRPPETPAQFPMPAFDSAPTTPQSNAPQENPLQPPPPSAPASSDNSAATPDGPGMVLVDVVIISTHETISTSKGINLLNALTLQLGSATASGYSWAYDSSAVSRTVITKAVTIPALAYSLNIANAASSLNEVLARPTLAAIEGLPSEFFAGVNVNAGVLSTTTVGSSSIVPVDKRFGVKLAVTPNFLAGGMVKLKVGAQRTFAVPNSGGNGFAYRFDIAETTTDANVVMKMGDTLVLSGLTEKETSSNRNGVPGLQDVPVAQYLFSTKQNVDFQRSALILITPRAPLYAAQADSSAGTDSEKVLRARLGFSTELPSNVESIVEHMSGNELFRQFRQGDVAMERWDRTRTTGDRLRQALSFLYY